MNIASETLSWIEEKNGVSLDCTLDIAIHPSKSNIILVIFPGVDGSVDGYENKYIKIAEKVQSKTGVAVVRCSNPFISSFHWESNFRRVLEYIEDSSTIICGSKDYYLYLFAHSAGASITAHIAWEYPYIKRLLLVNTATKLDMDKIAEGLRHFKGDRLVIVYGDQDASRGDVDKISPSHAKNITVIDTDHYFSGSSINKFIGLPTEHLFDKE